MIGISVHLLFLWEGGAKLNLTAFWLTGKHAEVESRLPHTEKQDVNLNWVNLLCETALPVWEVSVNSWHRVSITVYKTVQIEKR